MTTQRARQLEKLAMSLPSANQQTAQAQQQARQIQLQDQIKQAGPGAGTAFSQQLGAQQAQQAGAIQLDAQQKTQQQAQLVGQMGLEQQARQQRQEGFEQGLKLSAEQRNVANRLSNLGLDLKTKLLDEQLDFAKDKAGQTLFNERQLLDFALTKAQSAEEFAEYSQQAQQMQERELQMLTTAQKKIEATLTRGYITKGKQLDRNLQMELTKKNREIKKAIQDKQNKAANRSSMFGAAGTILGAAAGSLIPIPGVGTTAGAMLGGTVGSGIGTVLSGTKL